MKNMCLLIRYIAIDVLLLFIANFWKVFIVPSPSTGHGSDHIGNTPVLLAYFL
jgi:hypothetical protein